LDAAFFPGSDWLLTAVSRTGASVLGNTITSVFPITHASRKRRAEWICVRSIVKIRISNAVRLKYSRCFPSTAARPDVYEPFAYLRITFMPSWDEP